MSDTQEPTMEEILASIRRIISEDDAPESAPAAAAAPAEAPAAPAAAAEAEPATTAASADDDDDEVLELTDRVETHGDLDILSAPAVTAAPEPPPEPSPAIAPTPPAPVAASADSLLSVTAAAAAAAAFGRLSNASAMPAPGRSLEDVVRELLRPLLQEWLDQNLAAIVQRTVDAEVARISRGG
jgi:cell pole-organizing protein PopZ